MSQRPKNTARAGSDLSDILSLAKTRTSLKTVLALVKGAQSWTACGIERQKAAELASAPRATLAWRLLRPIIGRRTSAEANNMLYMLCLAGLGFFPSVSISGAMLGLGLHMNGSAGASTAVWLAGAAICIGALGLVFSYRFVMGTIRVDIVGPAAWETHDLEAYQKARLSRGNLHAAAHQLILDIAWILPAATFEVEALVQDRSVSNQFLRVNWVNPTGIRESEVVFGWNGIFELEPS